MRWRNRPAGADYLHRARTGPPPSRWTQLLTHLRENPDGALARGLSTRLALTLIRDTYRPGDDVRGLLTTRWSGDDLERYLIARVLPAAYTRRPGSPAPPYSQTQAEQVLAFLARQMNQRHTRNLAWRQIPRWAPTTPRILASMLMAGLLGAILVGLVLGGGLPLGITLMLGLSGWRGEGQASPQKLLTKRRQDRVVGLRVGLVLGLVNFFAVVLLVGLMYGITSSVTWPTTLAWRQLRRSHRVPAVALMPFLEDARGRHVLRTVGAVYQFRHATLQDQLAGHTTVSQPTSLETQIGA
ncbi:MAG: hypothetical protein ACRDQ4_13900 [Pseudonocardiaceae bacterium]